MDLRQNLDQTRSQLTSATQELTTIKTKIQQLTRNNQSLIEDNARIKKHYEQRLENIQDE
jgi:vacuolar-type H+-ATPase subunit D/Vma8